MPAPASTGASQRTPLNRSRPVNQPRPQPNSPQAAPRPLAAPHCALSGNAASGCFSRQATSSHSSTPGKATAEPADARASHDAKLLATKSTPTAITTCTNSKARSTTPTWQTSKVDGARAGLDSASNSVLPNALLRSSLGRVVSGQSLPVSPGSGVGDAQTWVMGGVDRIASSAIVSNSDPH